MYLGKKCLLHAHNKPFWISHSGLPFTCDEDLPLPFWRSLATKCLYPMNLYNGKGSRMDKEKPYHFRSCNILTKKQWIYTNNWWFQRWPPTFLQKFAGRLRRQICPCPFADHHLRRNVSETQWIYIIAKARGWTKTQYHFRSRNRLTNNNEYIQTIGDFSAGNKPFWIKNTRG